MENRRRSHNGYQGKINPSILQPRQLFLFNYLLFIVCICAVYMYVQVHMYM